MAYSFGVDLSFDCLEECVLAASVVWVTQHSTIQVPLAGNSLNIPPCLFSLQEYQPVMAGKVQLLWSAAHKWRASSCSGIMFCTLPHGNPSSVLAVRQAAGLWAVTWMSGVAVKTGCLLHNQTSCLLEEWDFWFPIFLASTTSPSSVRLSISLISLKELQKLLQDFPQQTARTCWRTEKPVENAYT